MKRVFIVEAKRSPLGRSHPEKGAFRGLRADELLAQLLQYTKNVWSTEVTDDFFVGCVGQHLEQGKNIARLSLLLAGFPDSVPGATINRLCGSSLQAFHVGAMTIQTGSCDAVLAGGVEHMQHVPMQAALDYHKDLLSRYEFPFTNMGLTAERVASRYEITREKQDQFALESHRRAIRAQDAGHWIREILPVRAQWAEPSTGSSESPTAEWISADQTPRRDSSLEALAQLKPAFREGGTVTAGNSSPLSDGASLVWLAGEEFCKEQNLKPQIEVYDTVTVGLDPLLMGMGPVPAIQKLLQRNGLRTQDVGRFEINEAFAAQAIACIEHLDLHPERVNPWGGAIALGHPLGCTGTRLITTLVNGMLFEKSEWGVASMCVGHGQGMASLIKRVN